MISWSRVMATTLVLLIPVAAKAIAWGKMDSSEPGPVCPFSIRKKAPPAELAAAFPCWKRKGVP